MGWSLVWVTKWILEQPDYRVNPSEKQKQKNPHTTKTKVAA